MKYAIISDIHSNLEALNASFEVIDTLDVDKTACLGDIVGYNANPNECIEILRERGVQCIMGNHDERAAGIKEPDDFNLMAETAVLWTREQLRPESREFLENLPATLTVDKRFLAFHGWVDDTDSYIMGEKDALRNLALMKTASDVNLGFFGHTHLPVVYAALGAQITASVDAVVELNDGVAYLINPGSVGQPRNRDPRASFVVYDAKKATITRHTVEYDINETARKILEAGLPERLAERLKLGW